MRKLKLQIQVTIDSFVAGPNGEMDFVMWNWDDRLKEYVTELTNPVSCIVLGRKLAEGFIPYWAGVAVDENNPQQSAGKKFSETEKVVFTKTLKQSPWENTVLANGNIVDEIEKLKKQDDGDIIAYGGAQFVSSLIKHGLVDDIHLFINPTAIGKGMAIFSEVENTKSYNLVKATPFDCGIVVLHYQPSA